MSSESFRVKFTGNWYFDCGIVGFLSIIEKLKGGNYIKEIIGDGLPKEVVIKDFFLAYWMNQIDKAWRKKIPEEQLESVLKKVKNIDTRELELEEVKEKLRQIAEEKLTIKNKARTLIYKNMNNFYRNFLFFQKEKPSEILEEFEKYLKTPPQKEIERTISKFLISFKEFSNEFFDKPPTLATLNENLRIPLHIFLICVEDGFVEIPTERGESERIFVYVPQLERCYEIHKRLKTIVKRVKSGDLFRLAFNEIVDILYKEKSWWILENLFLISYKGIAQQAVVGVKYLPFDKTVAEILFEDELRKNIIRVIRIRKGEKREDWREVSGLDGLVKKEVLSYHILDYLDYLCHEEKERGKETISFDTFLYWAAIDIINSEEKDKPREMREKFKKIVREMRHTSKELFSFLFERYKQMQQKKKIEKYFYFLLKSVRKGEKSNFINAFCHFLAKENIVNKEINKYVLIILEKENWIPYTISLLISFLKFLSSTD